jgi:hypothetical protein
VDHNIKTDMKINWHNPDSYVLNKNKIKISLVGGRIAKKQPIKSGD